MAGVARAKARIAARCPGLTSLWWYPFARILRTKPLLLSLQNEQMEIRRVAEGEITQKEFYNEYWKKGIPLVFTEASRVWKATGTFTPDFFRENFTPWQRSWTW